MPNDPALQHVDTTRLIKRSAESLGKFGAMFSGEYIQGYTAALQEAIWTVEHIAEDMKLHKRRPCSKEYAKILKCMLANRARLREDPDAFVRCHNNIPGGYEVFPPLIR